MTRSGAGSRWARHYTGVAVLAGVLAAGLVRWLRSRGTTAPRESTPTGWPLTAEPSEALRVADKAADKVIDRVADKVDADEVDDGPTAT